MHALTSCGALLIVLLSGPACQRAPMPTDHFHDAPTADLAQAVSRGDAYAIGAQIAQGSDPDAQGDDGLTLLQHAIQTGSSAGLQALLEAGADPDRAGYQGSAALHTAAIAGDPVYVERLLAHGARPDVAHAVTGEQPLAKAVGMRTTRQFHLLLDAGADVNAADRTGNTALHRAAMVNAGDHVLALLEAGADPRARNAQDASFQTYYFNVPEAVLNADSRQSRSRIIAWLRAHDVALEANVPTD